MAFLCPTSINIPGKNGGETKTYNICCSKVYAQTLFLGGSIKSFNASLAWGTEGSKLTVDIAVDKCSYPSLININGQPVSRPVGIASRDDYTEKRKNNTFDKDENGNSLIPGKVYYVPYDGKIISKYWYDADPGFYGEILDSSGNVDLSKTVDIVGCSVYFKYDDFEFNGIVKSWERTGGSSGTSTYTINIEAPSFLLNQTQMILGDYNGAVFSKAIGSQFGIEYGFPKVNEGNYVGAIGEQNIPNLLNVYGYLEDHCDINGNKPANTTSLYQYGRSGRSEQGIPAVNVLAGLNDLVNSVEPVTSNPQKKKILRYSPYGRIVSKAPKFKSTLNDVFTLAAAEKEKYSFGLIEPSKYANYTKLNLDLYMIPYGINYSDIINNGIIPYNYRISENKMDVLTFFNNLAENTGQSIFISMELIVQENKIYPYLKINSINTLENSPENIVQEFITDVANQGVSVTSYSKGEELSNNEPIRTVIVGGKQQRLYQVANFKYALKQSTLRYNSYANVFLKVDHYPTTPNDPNVLQHYRFFDTANIRNPDHYLDSYVTPATPFGRVELYTNIFKTESSIFGGTARPVGNYISTIQTTFRTPLGTENTAIPGGNEYASYIYDAICPYFGNDPITGYVRPVSHHHKNKNAIPGSIADGGGIGYLVYFRLAEIGSAIGVTYSNSNFYARISESEIRAAMSGFDAYVGFLTGMLEDGSKYDCFNSIKKPGFPIDIWKHVIGPVIFTQEASAITPYSSFSDPLIKGLVSGLSRNFNINATNGSAKQNGNESVSLTPNGSVLNDERIYSILNNLQTFFKKIGDEFYGKKYMVNVPSPQVWRDDAPFRDVNGNELLIRIGTTNTNTPIFLRSGSQKIYYSFEPADFAWEEPGNWIDDSLRVGDAVLDPLLKDDGSIEPILGFNNTFQYNYSKELYRKIYDASKTASSNMQGIHFWKWDIARKYGAGYGVNSSLVTLAGDNSISLGFWEPALQLKDGENVVVPQPNKLLSDPFGTAIPMGNGVSKIYVKASVQKEFETYVINGQIYPKIIISVNQPILINSINPEALSVQAAVAEYFINEYDDVGAVVAVNALANSMFRVPTAQESSTSPTASNAVGQNKANKQFNNLSMAPKAAMPFFAGIPIVDNTSVYGPWVSAPDLLKDTIFPFDSEPIKNKKIETLIGGVKLEINSDFVPWQYGGMRILDEIALLTVGQDNNYQQKLETGNLTIRGVPFLNLGSELKAAGVKFRGPTVSNIQCQISDNGASTTYTFRTFTKKFTLFNKENSDRIKQASEATIKLNKEFRESFNKILPILNGLANGERVNGSWSTGGDSVLRSYSPANVLVGYSAPFYSRKVNNNFKMGYYPNNTVSHNQWTRDSIKQMTTVGLQESREIVQEFDELYSTKAFMSLDGLLHPVSFYPTMLNSTASYKPYTTTNDGKKSGCPVCRGTKQYTWFDKTLYCDFCSDVLAGQEPDISSSNNGRLPPYILSDQADETIIQNPNKLEELLLATTKSKKIDYVNLNPIIMPVGELRNKYAQDTDYTAHHIDIIGRSVVPPLGSLSISAHLNADLNGTELLDQNDLEAYGDWNSVAFDQATDRVATSTSFVTVGEKNFEYFQNNHRFLALRGPLVMAGWGFDTDGFPVPNASGEPKSLNANGYPLRIRNLKDQTGGYENYPGTILGKNQTWDAEKGEWTAPIKENNFYKGWGLRPDMWPVGPVDLRWDPTRKVWTAPQPYGLVDIQLEDDLVPPFPARGFLNSADKKSPLPNNLRRMVFVRDSTESYGAPRGTKLTCYYDEASGFYEPVSKQNIVALGTINNDGTATILDAYAKGFDPVTGQPETPESIIIQFNNYLNYDISSSNQPGIFTFIKNEWILTGTNSCGG